MYSGVLGNVGLGLFHEHEVDGQNQADEGGDVVPMEGLASEDQYGKGGEYGQ